MEEFKVGFCDEVPIVANLECPITQGGKPASGKVVLRAQEDYLTKAFGKSLTAVCLANNHTLDYGSVGLDDTISLLNNRGIKYFGIGRDQGSLRSWIVVEVGGLKVGLCGYVCPSTHPVFVTQSCPGVPCLDLRAIRLDILAMRRQGVSRIIVSLHWGAEEVTYPKASDIQIARAIADLGADMVVGHHSHCIQASEMYRGCPIFYGLGNAVMPDLDVPNNCDTLGACQKNFVKAQRSWNRRSLAVDFDVVSKALRVTGLIYNNKQLSSVGLIAPPDRRLVRGRLLQEAAYRCSGFFGNFRNLSASFIDNPRLPRVAHLRGIFSRRK